MSISKKLLFSSLDAGTTETYNKTNTEIIKTFPIVAGSLKT
jgi:hypothetical protein